MPFCPATGGARVASPGTNLAIISVTRRRRPNESCGAAYTHGRFHRELAEQTQHTWPYLRPIRNQEESAISDAARETKNAREKFS